MVYMSFNQFVIPFVAPMLGREAIKETENIKPATFWTKLLNRNYVRPELNRVLVDVSQKLDKKYSELQLIYLDANFPFYNGFPLLPHLSHNDGRKIDLSFIYENEEGKTVNGKPSISGYGIFVEPKRGDENTNEKCLSGGHWQYDMAKYLTLGIQNKELKLSKNATKFLILQILKEPTVQKIFIEPHIKKRLTLNNKKIRFHGCHAVRHDDHIHVQVL